MHVPYCLSKCPYCDFNSYALAGASAEAMVEAILREAAAWGELAGHLRGGFTTVFVGGGTPTALGVGPLRRLLAGLRERLPLDQVSEFTVEANPGTLSAAAVEAMRAEGVDRVSLGVQSLQAAELRTLGRIHTVQQALESVRRLQAGGIPRRSLDLMFAIPGQTADTWRDTLEQAASLEVEHISTYCLTLEPGTPFHARWLLGQLELPDEAQQVRQYRMAVRVLARHGFARYEISNFARPGAACRHNLNYWQGGTYLGIGPGAHSHWAGRRFGTVAAPGRYLAATASARPLESVIAFVERLTVRQRMDERVMLGLRLAEGLDGLAFQEAFGVCVEQAYCPKTLASLQEAGWLRRRGEAWQLTARGVLVADAIIREVVSSPA